MKLPLITLILIALVTLDCIVTLKVAQADTVRKINFK